VNRIRQWRWSTLLRLRFPLSATLRQDYREKVRLLLRSAKNNGNISVHRRKVCYAFRRLLILRSTFSSLSAIGVSLFVAAIPAFYATNLTEKLAREAGRYTHLGWLAIFLAAASSMFLPLFLVGVRSPRARRQRWHVRVFFYWPAVMPVLSGILVTAGWRINAKLHYANAGFFAAMFFIFSLSLAAMLYGMALGMVGLLTVLEIYERRRFTETVLVEQTVEMIDVIDTFQGWKGLETLPLRSKMLRKLENIARCFETPMRASLRPNDKHNSSWYFQLSTANAQYVRSLKRWVLLPRPDTFVVLRAKVVELLCSILNRDYDGIPRSDSPREIGRHWFYSVVDVFRVVVIASLPLAMVLVAKHFNVKVSDTISNFSVAWGILFVVISLVLRADPSFKDKVEFIRMFTGLKKD
jgi:hypothetical protein